MNKAVKLLRDSKSARWIVLACLVVPMFASYFFDDMFSTLSQLFQQPQRQLLRQPCVFWQLPQQLLFR